MRATSIFCALTLLCLSSCTGQPSSRQPDKSNKKMTAPKAPEPASKVDTKNKDKDKDKDKLKGQAAKPDAAAKPKAAATPSPSKPGELKALRGPLQLKDIAKVPAPGAGFYKSFHFSQDGSQLAYLKRAPGGLTYELYAQDLKNGQERKIGGAADGGDTEENLSPEEKLRRERLRERSLGITQFIPAKNSDKMLVPLRGKLYLKDNLDAPMTLLFDGQGSPPMNARFSPDGRKVAFVWKHELHVINAKAGAKAKALTRGAKEGSLYHGEAEYIAQEEMGRYTGFWWSPDSRYIAYTEVDESEIPYFPIVHQGKDAHDQSARDTIRYPFAGGPNAKVKLGVISANGGSTRWIDFGEWKNKEHYLARVNWRHDQSLLVQLLNRHQSELAVLLVDPRRGRSKVFLTEKTASWINLHDIMHPIMEGELKGQVIWASERSGFQHLYRLSPDGKTATALTQGDWVVDDVLKIDEKGKRLWFASTKEDPTQRQIYEIALDGDAKQSPKKVSPEAGSHAGIIDPTFTRWINMHSSIKDQPSVRLRKLSDASVIKEIEKRDDPKVQELKLTPPQLVKVKTRDGDILYGSLYRPDPKVFGPGPYPTIISVYGGPHVQRVVNGWRTTASMREQLLRQNGYVVLKLDNRGSTRRGVAFESKIRHDMGNLEVQDQEDGVRWLVKEGLSDPKRVGIFGWSYGGYMSAMSVARAPKTFRLGIAGAPVTHWDGYDTCYTERYMGLPAENKKGYQESSVMEHVPKMEGKLLLVHGLIDENVHFRHTARLVNSLIEHGKDFELLMYPDARHMPRKEADRLHMERKIMEFIQENL